MNRERFILICFLQAIFYTAVWMINDYTGLLLSLIISVILIAILMISWISDRLEYGNVGKWYYPLLLISIIVPIVISLLFWKFKSGDMDWMHPPFG